MSDHTVTLSFLDAMSALWRPESVGLVEQAIREQLAILRTIDITAIDSQTILGYCGLRVNLFVREFKGSLTGKTLELARTELGLSAQGPSANPTIPERLLAARVDVQPAWLASA